MKNKLIQIDCNKYMKDIPDNHFDLAIVDPPYGIGAGIENIKQFNYSTIKWKNPYCNNLSKKEWDRHVPDNKYFQELFRISKNQIIWGGNYFTEHLYKSRGWIVWDKIIPKKFNKSEAELAWTSFDKSIKLFTFLWHGFQRGEDVDRIHPTQKPVALYKWLLTNYAKPGYKLFDSHSGSGSFRIAAYDMGFDLVSCELDADYCRDNEARYQKHIQQIDLFKPEELQKNIFQEQELFDES